MKQCTKCSKLKPKTEFYVKDKKSGRLHAQCKTCYKEHRKSTYKEHYEKYRNEYLERGKIRRAKLRAEFRSNMLKFLDGKACIKCGENDIRVLELDHIDATQKDFSISHAVRIGKNWIQVQEEIKKCQILCANCHKIKTAEEYGWYKNIGGTERI